MPGSEGIARWPMFYKTVGDMPTAAAYGVGSAWAGAMLYWSDGVIWQSINGRDNNLTQKKGKTFGGNYGRRISMWESSLSNQAGTVSRISTTAGDMHPHYENQNQFLRISHNATQSFGQQNVTTSALSTSSRKESSVGIWIRNPTYHHLGATITLFNGAADKSLIYHFNVKPTANEWEFFTISGIVIGGANPWTHGTDQISIIRVGQNNDMGQWVSGDSIDVGTLYFGTKGRARFLICNDDCVTTVVNPFNTTDILPASGRSYREIVEYYGFKGTIYCVPSLIGTTGYLTQTELLNLHDNGWAIGSHSWTHPSYSSRGLKSLGPVGYADVSDPYHSQATNDDSAIYTDIMQGIEGLTNLGIPDADRLFSIPQGAVDDYVRSAIIRSGVKHVRDISSYNDAHTLSIGLPTGDRDGSGSKSRSGWVHQYDAVQTDGEITDVQAKSYIDDCILMGATGANYHHGTSSVNGQVLDSVLAYLKIKSDLGLIDVMTASQAAYDDGLF